MEPMEPKQVDIGSILVPSAMLAASKQKDESQLAALAAAAGSRPMRHSLEFSKKPWILKQKP